MVFFVIDIMNWVYGLIVVCKVVFVGFVIGIICLVIVVGMDKIMLCIVIVLGIVFFVV